METIGKILSLLLLTVFGVATAVLYVLEYNSKPIRTESIQDKDYTFSSNSEIINYRKKLRANIPVTINEVELQNTSKKRPLWTDTYTREILLDPDISKDVIELAQKKSISELNKEMKSWHEKYNLLLKEDKQDKSAKHAYNKYKIYKQALRLKRAY